MHSSSQTTADRNPAAAVRKKARSIGIGKSGRHDLSGRADKLLEGMNANCGRPKGRRREDP
jgi:hypothetical protein